jgi:CheY-like chemotaxis protein
MRPALSAITVLVVDDDDDALALTEFILEQHGAFVASASGADEALKLLACVKPDVLLSDITMPGHDGLWLLGEARGRGYLDGWPRSPSPLWI